MAFDSLPYILFLVVVVAVYWTLSHRQQNVFLVAASYLFYGWWNWRFLPLLMGATLIDYWLSHWMEAATHALTRRRILILSICLNLTSLGLFKYSNFMAINLARALPFFGMRTNPSFIRIILPIGISFYTFESIAYMVSVYRCELPAAKSFIDYALFIAFFPHLIAGPIMQPAAFIPQCSRSRVFKGRRFLNGLDFIVWGLVKKMFIADGIGYYVDQIFALREPSSLLVAVGAVGFGIQILADFSAYTDIARGSAKLIGFELRHNFYSPYCSRSISEFWRRWHVSLSNWIRDYIYIPLGGSRVSSRRYCFNMAVTWILCGLWHGAAWKFIFWGLYYGVLLIYERFRPTIRKDSLIQWIKTFVAVQLGWLLFRTPSMREFFSYFSIEAVVRSSADVLAAWYLSLIFLFFLLPWLAKLGWQKFRARENLTPNQTWEMRLVVYAFSFLVLMLFGKTHSSAFIYFQF